jgi:hypothetical protein
MAGKKSKEETVLCPVGRFFQDLEEASSAGRSSFFEHLDRSRMELFKAIRSLLDEKIEHIEKGARGREKRKATKIKVE